MTKRLLAVCVVLGLLAAEGLLYVLAGNIAEGVRGPMPLILVILFSIGLLVLLMRSAPRP
jgi:hypothetical protein